MAAPDGIRAAAGAVSVPGAVLEQLNDLAVPGVKVGDAHASPLDADDRAHLLVVAEPDDAHPEQIAIKGKRPIELCHGDADVMDAAHTVRRVRLSKSLLPR